MNGSSYNDYNMKQNPYEPPSPRSSDPNLRRNQSPNYLNGSYVQRQKSIRSITPSKRSSNKLNLSNISYSQNEQQAYLDNNLKNIYEQNEKILNDEKNNLKQQNILLLKEINKLKGQNKKIKELYRNKEIEVQMVRAQCQVQKKRADEMKDIIMSRLANLQNKIFQTSNQQISQQCQSILQALNQGANEQIKHSTV